MAAREIHHPEREDGTAVGAASTPLVRVDGVWVKFEHLNPSGSIKDRVASHVLTGGLRDGTLRPGQEVVEPTSGNAGIALAYWAQRLGLRAVVFMPENMTIERQTIIRGHGARLMLTPDPEGVVGAIRRARDYARGAPNRYLFDQFDDEAGVEAQAALGREALAQARREGVDRFDAVIAGVGPAGRSSEPAGRSRRRTPGRVSSRSSRRPARWSASSCSRASALRLRCRRCTTTRWRSATCRKGSATVWCPASCDATAGCSTMPSW